MECERKKANICFCDDLGGLPLIDQEALWRWSKFMGRHGLHAQCRLLTHRANERKWPTWEVYLTLSPYKFVDQVLSYAPGTRNRLHSWVESCNPGRICASKNEHYHSRQGIQYHITVFPSNAIGLCRAIKYNVEWLSVPRAPWKIPSCKVRKHQATLHSH